MALSELYAGVDSLPPNAPQIICPIIHIIGFRENASQVAVWLVGEVALIKDETTQFPSVLSE